MPSIATFSLAHLRRTALAALALGLSGPVLAAWDLDAERSTVQFLSVKNASVAEVHHFTKVSGGIDDDGEATVTIDLASVETMIPIRNERMREMLFETARFPEATLSARVPDDLDELDAGETTRADLEVSIDLHGKTALYSAAAHVTRLADGSLQVVLAAPVLVKAADFGLEGGVEMLREVAGLKNISTAVPVDATLVFEES
ncbi:MAG: YceI family protein [Halieaceae bacterium]|jgi:polyisoprenoid-binding protein YceI|nr:YceI family protein [Halieaceae bacterium]